MSFYSFVLVFIGGGLGSVLRYLVGQTISFKQFPIATLFVNVIGSFFIGWFVAHSLSQNNTIKLLVVTGFCGGFTTFSTFSLDVIQLLQQQKIMLALTYIVISFLVCITSTAFGFYLANGTFFKN